MRVTFRVNDDIKLGRYITVHGGGKNVTYHFLNVRVKITKIITSKNVRYYDSTRSKDVNKLILDCTGYDYFRVLSRTYNSGSNSDHCLVLKSTKKSRRITEHKVEPYQFLSK